MNSKTVKHNLQERLSKLFDLEKLPPHLINDLPSKWEKHGDLILLPANSFTANEWNEIDSIALWDCVAHCFKVQRLARKDVIDRDGFRSPKVRILKGVDDPWVCHVDNGIQCHYNITKCMFSIGNISEKLRMAKLNCKNEVIVDMFTGIGYFTLPLLVHGKAAHIHACDWNPEAIEALKKNLEANKVQQRCTVYYGDNRKVCPVGLAQRVLMGLIPDAMGSIEPACRAISIETGATMHIHGNVSYEKNGQESKSIKNISCNRTLKQEWVDWAENICGIVKNTMSAMHSNNSIHVNILHIQRVKSYGPRIDHLVLDLKVTITANNAKCN